MKHCYNRVHGLSLNSMSYAEKGVVPNSNELIKYLKMYYNYVATPEKPSFGIKNNFLKDILKKTRIPFVDLDNLIPSIPDLERNKRKWVCAYHRYNGVMCAYRKCFLMYQHLQDIDSLKEQPSKKASIQDSKEEPIDFELY